MSTTKKNNPALLTDTIPEIHERGKSSRTGMNREELAQSFRDNLYSFQGIHPALPTTNDFYLAAASTIRQRLVERWLHTGEATFLTDAKVVCYRQHPMTLYIIALYHRIKDNPDIEILPGTFLLGGKTGPGYFTAKRIIKLITSVADAVNSDPDVHGRLKVVFLPNFSVKLGRPVYPAADLSEQISLAGKEASGTGNMKFSMNGALTIGTLDGANVAIREEVGQENFFLLGLTTPEVYERKAQGYTPRESYESNAGLRQVLDSICRGRFSNGDRTLFSPSGGVGRDRL